MGGGLIETSARFSTADGRTQSEIEHRGCAEVHGFNFIAVGSTLAAGSGTRWRGSPPVTIS